MIVIVCLDDANGMMFNKLRQSKDRLVNEDIMKLCDKQPLWVNAYTAKLFEESNQDLLIDEQFLKKALEGDYCFVENVPLAPYEDKIEKIIIYRWNRKYPADRKFDIDLERWQPDGVTEFAGYSHEKITRETYVH